MTLALLKETLTYNRPYSVQMKAFMVGMSVHAAIAISAGSDVILSEQACDSAVTLSVAAYHFSGDCEITFMMRQQKHRKVVPAYDIGTIITLLPSLSVRDAYLVGCHCGWCLQQ